MLGTRNREKWTGSGTENGDRIDARIGIRDLRSQLELGWRYLLGGNLYVRNKEEMRARKETRKRRFVLVVLL